MSQFSVDIRKFIQKANGNVDRAIRQTIILVSQGVIQNTPVDTGRARANWVFGSGSPNLSVEFSRFDPGGSSALAKIASDIGTKPPRLSYVTNSLPYIQSLEEGSSRQAPNGMVAVTLSSIQLRIDSYLRGLR